MPDSIEAQMLAAITASVMSTKAMAIEPRDQLVQRAQRRQAVGQNSGVFGLQVPLLDQVDDRGHRRHQQRRVADQDQHHVNHQPRVAHVGLLQAATGVPRLPTSVSTKTSGNRNTPGVWIW